MDKEIVIKLPEETYKGIMLGKWFGNGLASYIQEGTPLPKVHGDLIDRKQLINDGLGKGFCEWYDEIKYAQAIIEAEKGAEK